METIIENRPSNTIIRCQFSQGETLTSEGGSMVSMSSGLDIETTTKSRGKSGVASAAKRLLAGESFFLNHYTASEDQCELVLSPTLSGDIVDYYVEQSALVVQGTSFMAHYGDDLSISTEFKGLKNILSGESFFWIKTQGKGHLIFNAFGVIYTVDVDGEYIIDTGHVVAFEDTLKYHLSKVGNSWLSSFLGGEGFVLRFEGKGRVWCQSHNPSNFGSTIGPMLKTR